MPEVIFIGGPPASGKTTVARLLARRHGLRWYGSDQRTWDHRRRAFQAGVPAALRWAEMTHDERLTQSTPAEIDRLLLEEERGAMILEDVSALPDWPLVVAEGTPLLPRLLAGRAEPAVWLLPEPSEQRQRLARQGAPQGTQDPERTLENWVARAALVSEKVEAQATELSLPLLRPRSVAEALALVESHFAAALARGPRAETAGERQALVREENLVFAEHYRLFLATVPKAGRLASWRGEFSCECGSCIEQLELTVPEFEERAEHGLILLDGHSGLA